MGWRLQSNNGLILNKGEWDSHSLTIIKVGGYMIDTLKQDVHYLTLDLHHGTSGKICFRQSDHESRLLEVVLMAHESFVDLNHARVDMWVAKSDDTLAVKQCDVDVHNSTVRIALTRQMLAVMPEIKCEFVVTYDDGSVLKFPSFTIELDETIVNEQKVVSSDEFSLFFYALARMEDWITNFDKKYSSITQTFDNKLRIINDTFKLKQQEIENNFEELYINLGNTITDDYKALRLEIVEAYEQLYIQLSEQFAIKFREVEKRFNMLEQKAITQTDNIERLLNSSIEMEQDIRELKTSSEQVLDDIIGVFNLAEATYDDMVALYEDAQIKFQEMQNQFALDQTVRDNLFKLAQKEREDEFNQAQQSRANEFANSEQSRKNTFTQNENERKETFQQSEGRRQDTFNHNEDIRQTTFLEAEVIRNNNETERMANEEERQQGYIEMREQMVEFDEIINPFSGSISVSPNVSEKGSTVSEIVANWSYNKDIVSQSVDNVATPIGDRSKTIIGTFTTDKSVTLNATSKTNRNISVSAKLSFKNGIYYGVSSSTTYDSNLINSLSKVLDENKARTITVNSGVGQYIYYSYPSRLGTASFNVGGFDGGFNEVARINFTNASGYAEEYIIYKSTNANLGNTTVVIK